MSTHPLIVSNEIVSEILNVPDTSASDVLTDKEVASMFCVGVVISTVTHHPPKKEECKGKVRKKGKRTSNLTPLPTPSTETLSNLTNGDTHDSWLSPRPRHKHPHQPTHDFAAHVRTFNAPIALSVAHAPGSLPAKYHLRAANTQAAVNVTLDGMFEGLFDLRAKSAGTSVETRGGGTAVGSANVEANGSGRVSEGVSGLWAKWMSDEAVATGTGERRVEFDHEGYGRKMGWSGYGERPVEAGGAGAGEGGSGGGGAAGSAGSWGSTSRVEVVSSLSPVVLVLDGPG